MKASKSDYHMYVYPYAVTFASKEPIKFMKWPLSKSTAF